MCCQFKITFLSDTPSGLEKFNPNQHAHGDERMDEESDAMGAMTVISPHRSVVLKRHWGGVGISQSVRCC
jgi:hypothetical protein